jgi:hypothetical protein
MLSGKGDGSAAVFEDWFTLMQRRLINRSMSYSYPSLPWGWIGALLIVITVIDLILRGLALWRSARAGQSVWFVVLLIVNTAGILPVIYLLLQRNRPGETK